MEEANRQGRTRRWLSGSGGPWAATTQTPTTMLQLQLTKIGRGLEDVPTASTRTDDGLGRQERQKLNGRKRSSRKSGGER
ncbi:hypothetical protein TWF718_011347 [Orbilia javanica]|uniref:Uncharacterized protein n=1 Tax=Orbilia javanica TaxID=47235 RepID=A0AAN8R9N1_9PEZI